MVVAFFGWLCFSLATVNKIEIGLDQEVSMPDDSYMLKYFDYMQKYLSVGPPFFLVVNNTGLQFDMANPDIYNKLCGRAGCEKYSLANQVNLNWFCSFTTAIYSWNGFYRLSFGLWKET